METIFKKTTCIVLGILTLIVLAPMTFGASERIVMGQYNVSFDLNTPMNHTIESQSPLVSNNGTNYRAYIRFTNQTQILMGLDVSKTTKDSTLEPEERFVSALALQDKNATVTTRTIDNKPGILTTSVSKSGNPTFTFSYWLDSKKCDCGDVFVGTTKLEMVGIVPRNITENLLNTLHVTSSTNASMQAQPNLPAGGRVEVGGTQGAAIAKQLQPQPPLNPSPATSYISPSLERDMAGIIGPDDPSNYYLYHWANGDLTTSQILRDISQSQIMF